MTFAPMRRSKYSEEQVIGILKEHDAGLSTAEVCRKYGVSKTTFYKWRGKFGGMEVLSMPPTLDRARRENSASSDGELAGGADREMKQCRHLVADRAMRSDRVVVSTPSLAFSAGAIRVRERARIWGRGRSAQTVRGRLPWDSYPRSITLYRPRCRLLNLAILSCSISRN